jgi:hypothetical protein
MEARTPNFKYLTIINQTTNCQVKYSLIFYHDEFILISSTLKVRCELESGAKLWWLQIRWILGHLFLLTLAASMFCTGLSTGRLKPCPRQLPSLHPLSPTATPWPPVGPIGP